MKATALFLAASALAAVSAVAYDGYGYDPRPASSYNNTISGAAHIGYDSRYAYKDVMASSVLNRSGVFNIGGELNLNWPGTGSRKSARNTWLSATGC